MTMTNEEILREYKAAKAPSKQINILEDLNQCSREKILSILVAGGAKLPGNVGPKNAPVTPAPAPVKLDLATRAMNTIREITSSGLSDESAVYVIEGVLKVIMPLLWEAQA